jgi:hypothetical protein
MYALFIKIDGQWRFQGLTEHEELVSEFEETVETEIEITEDMEVKTEAYFCVNLPD